MPAKAYSENLTLRDEPAAGLGKRRGHRLTVVVDQLLRNEALHHRGETLVRDQEALRAVLVHVRKRGRLTLLLREPREHALARFFEIRLLPLFGHWFRHGSPSSWYRSLMQIWVDADACPQVIKEILLRAAECAQVLTTLIDGPIPPPHHSVRASAAADARRRSRHRPGHRRPSR